MENEKIYVKGLNTFGKNPNTPDFVLGKLIIMPNELFTFLKSAEIAQYLSEYNSQTQLKCDIVMGKDGKIKFTVDTWKPQPKKEEPKDDGDLPF